MITTTQQDQDFLTHLLSNRLLERAIEWIRQNMSPEDVFSKFDLEIWAENNNYDDVIGQMAKDAAEKELWAKNNNYIDFSQEKE